MSEEKFGIENMKKCYALLIEAGNVASQIKNAEPGVGNRLAPIANILDELMALVGVQWTKLDDEWKDYSEAEKAEMQEFFKTKFDIAEDNIEYAIEKGHLILMKYISATSELIELITFLKK